MWLIQLCIIILAALVCGALAERLGQSRVVGEIAAGLLLGPSVLGAINADFYQWVFSNAAMPAMSQLGELGLVLLMFQLGLHLDLKSLRGRAQMRVPVAVALLGIAIPFAVGCAIAVFSRPVIAPDAPALGYVLFCGIALSISALPVMARIVMDLRIEGTFTAAISLTAASLTDVSGWLILAAIVAISTGDFTWSQIVRNVAFLLIFVAASMLVMRPLWNRIVARTKARSVTTAMMPALICYVFVSSWITAEIGFHSAFGALMAAIVVRDLPGLKDEWRQRVEGFVALVLMPVFFALAGMQANLGSISSPNFWPWFCLFLIGAVAGKFGGSYLGARWAGVGHRDASVIGALMNTRGLMELIVLTIGLKLHILPPPVYTMLFIMALVTTAMTVPMLRLLGHDARHRMTGTAERAAEVPAK